MESNQIQKCFISVSGPLIFSTNDHGSLSPIICRLVSLSYGEMELTLDTWSYVKQLERERQGRGSSGGHSPVQ